MVRDLYKETKAEVFWPFEKTRGLGRKNRWDKRKRKTKKAMRKGHTGCFRHVINRSWKILALDRERFRCEVKDATFNSSKAFCPPPPLPRPLIKPYTKLIHNKPQINNVQNQLTRRAWFPSWAGRSWYSISAIST